MKGNILICVKDFDFNNIYYKKGDKFKIIGESGFRGLNIEDMNGNKIYEIAMISDHFVSLKEARDKKIKNLGI